MNDRNFTQFFFTEIAKHNRKDDAWVVIDGNVYDVTKYIELHPGGWLPIATLAGKDCTDALANYHPARVYKNLLPRYLIGTMKDYKVTTFQNGHRAIHRIRNNQVHSVGASLGASLSKALHNRSIGVEQVISRHARLTRNTCRPIEVQKSSQRDRRSE